MIDQLIISQFLVAMLASIAGLVLLFRERSSLVPIPLVGTVAMAIGLF